MTCDDNDNLPSEDTQEKQNLKRKLDLQTFDVDQDNLNYNGNKVIKTKSSEECINILMPDSTKTANQASLVQEHQENTKIVEGKKSKVVSNYSRKKMKRLEIETEFKILQSLIPKIANKQPINELEIIDACVNYIEALQEQLNIRNPQDHTCNTAHNDDTTMSTTTIRSIMSAITDEKTEDCFYQIQDDDVDDYFNSESSGEDCNDDESEEDKNNNKETADKETSLTDNISTNTTEHVVDRNMQIKSHAAEDNKSKVVDTIDSLRSSTV